MYHIIHYYHKSTFGYNLYKRTEDISLTEQKFLQDLEKKLWTSANKILPSLDAAVYKHVVLGMVLMVAEPKKKNREKDE